MTERFVHDGISIAYDVVGPDDGPPLLVLHGLSSSRRNWSDGLDALARTRRVFSLDHRGHGDSDRAVSYRGVDYAADAAAFIDEVVGGPVAVMGHSLGGLTGGLLLANRPDLVRVAVLEDPPLYINEPDVFDATMFGQVFPLMKMGIDAAQASDDPEGAVLAYLEQMPAIVGEGTMADALGPKKAKEQAWSWANFDTAALQAAIDHSLFEGYDPNAPISAPTLVVRADPALGAAFEAEHDEPFLARAPQGKVVEATGMGHSIHSQDLDWFLGQVLPFLDAHDPA